MKFALIGKKSGKYDIEAWYGRSKSSAQRYLSDTFFYEGEWEFKKYDKGWKISQESARHRAVYLY